MNGQIRLYEYLIDHGQADCYERLASVYDKQKRPGLARSTRLKGVSVLVARIGSTKTDGSDYLFLARLYEALKDGEKSFSTYVKGNKIFSNYFVLADELAEEYLSRQRWSDAVAVSEAALPFAKHDCDKRKLLEKLRTAYRALGLSDKVQMVEKQLLELKRSKSYCLL